MPTVSTFSVTSPSTAVPVDGATRKASFAVDVKNEGTATERVVVTVRAGAGGAGEDAADPAWFGPEQQRTLQPATSEQFLLAATVPPTLAPGSYGFVPVAYSADRDPAETEARGPSMSLVVPTQPPPPPPWWRRWWWLLALGVVLLAAVGVVLWLVLRGSDVQVPEVAGQAVAQATQTLQDAGFDVQRTDEESGEEAGTALRTDPAAGTSAPEGSTVELFVATAPQQTEPPVVAQGTVSVPQTWRFDLETGSIGAAGADAWFQAVTATERYLTPQSGGQLGLASSSDPSYATCSSTPLTDDRIPVQTLVPGSVVCVRTDQGRLSAAVVTSAPGPSPGTLVLSYRTWEAS